ncbi:MAG: TlpA family protein disulfide reductase [Tannerella sp.]|jgi:thiol-disulfide isomerase/thioredoxin|nr:TlpA family protein disulfide reductase [Tannerella sp.]
MKIKHVFYLLFVFIYPWDSEIKAISIPKQIVVAGKIDNYDPERPITLYVNRLGYIKADGIDAKADSLGNFIAIFESYHPTDVWITYKANFLVLLHPTDSLFVHFDGKYNNRPELLASIKFSGDAAKTNQDVAKFQQMYFSHENYADWDKKSRTVKEYDTEQYLQYLDTIKRQNKELYDKFVAENSPNEETKKWALIYIESDYYENLANYARGHREANGMNAMIKRGNNNYDFVDNWDVPKGFYDRLLDRLPIDSSMFISTYALRLFAERFNIYVVDNLRDRNIDGGVLPGGRLLARAKIVDSIIIHSTIEFVPDPLLLQIMLTGIFNKEFEKQDIATFEKYRELADTYIKEPFLKEPIFQKYLQTKARIENPKIYTEAILKDVSHSSVNQIVDSIMQSNKNKVIYVDFWATWCGPCLGEMPNSKIVEDEMKDKDVAFVYICLESEEQKYKATISKFQLGGQHYFLTRQQSQEIRTLFEISGIPFYLLIDKNGVITEKGSHLRPLDAKSKLKNLL